MAFVKLKDWKERGIKRNVGVLIREVQAKFNKIPEGFAWHSMLLPYQD